MSTAEIIIVVLLLLSMLHQHGQIADVKQEVKKLNTRTQLLESDLLYLREKGALPQGFLGIRVVDIPGEKGVLVKEVISGYGADEAGMKRGDIILRYNDIGIVSQEDLVDLIRKTRPGSLVKIEISRAGRKIALMARISERPARFQNEKKEREDIKDILDMLQRYWPLLKELMKE